MFRCKLSYPKCFRLIFLMFAMGTFRLISMFVNSLTVLPTFRLSKRLFGVEMITVQYLFISSILGLNSKVLSSISFGGRFMASLVPKCKMMHSGLCCKAGFILFCISLILVLEKLFTLTLCF